MKNVLMASTCLGLLLFGGNLFAQREERNEEFWKGRLFQRVREDIDRIQRDTPRISADQYRLVETKRDLDDLQNKMASNRYDQPELDRAIGAVEKVMADNNMNPRDREMLQEDLRHLREFREHHDGYR